MSTPDDDFGHLVHRTPARVVRAERTEDVVAAVTGARADGLRLAARGAGHSVYGRSQVDGGVVVDVTALRRVEAPRDGRVTVAAGATWRAVVEETLPRGLLPPVLPDYLDLTVGGTVVVGGVGGTTHALGVTSDHVLGLEVVTGAGEVRTCSPTESPELFDAVRGGLGQVGVVTEVTLGLVEAPAHARRHTITCPDLPTMLADARVLLADGRWDHLQGAILPTPDGWKYTLEGAELFSDKADDALDGIEGTVQTCTVTHAELLSRLEPLETALRGLGAWGNPHPWLTTFLGDAAADDVLPRLLDRTDPADLGRFGRVALSPIRAGAIATPLVRTPGGGDLFALNLLRFPAGDAETARRLVADNRAAYELVRAAGGVLYPVSALPMSPADWAAHFGERFPALAGARAAHDPDGLMTPGYEVF
ncbi:FAD-binding protein [Actinokineospora spheciospongiae]|uniref:FAD-binding protein n=1 Tax=Actinokineospora spheciospongiae TaxID=909613 RepID=UPI000D70C6EA|nr:FAD-binding protein [Actinokineospora spheciospongiae]PWW51949.1 FAD/FMN-containing dehydrogenase [Actinokineospora spheciospongiae]